MNGIRNGIGNALNNISVAWKNTWSGCKETVVDTFNNIWSSIKRVINSILGGIESMANGVVKGINTVISALNRLSFKIPNWVPAYGGESFGFNISQISSVSLPRLARGGVVNQATALIAGEAGKEAIVPLENNTGWIDKISSSITEYINTRLQRYGDNGEHSEIHITIPITLELDGETILKKMIKARKRMGYQIVVEEGLA